ncbi:M48 family metalloprotease [Megalodesulfovibrio gigas]|uniref:Putative peptidase M48, Ste24p n=1 Tax=Megalodesulfovibrio gigas (strain ATCC 19364 / DSM 1382 / NCIMB 9332 / VKM B-1759) TaxID=1121448 RepID=T2G971_MEGG1|nr:M48 family metalloprotease [Megalodesulfovibrio gigas]AGW12462.1 putative peptidase M48, Ste24p [Megalodesulfovibrio gigas DSM 1382 = ATCC 19364]
MRVRVLAVCAAVAATMLVAGLAPAQVPSMDQMLQQMQKDQGLSGNMGLPAGDPVTGVPALPNLNATREVMANYKALSPEQEYWLGRSVGALILGNYRPYPDEKANAYINLLGRSLATASGMPETFTGYRFLILDSDDINALAAPGGFIFVTKGLIRCCPHEEALAAVLAHEIGHIEKRHGLQAIKQARIQSALTGLAMQGLKEQGGQELAQLVSNFEGSITDVFNALVVAGYSRQAEAEADLAAMEILRRVGYPPSGMVDMLLAMEDRLDPARKDFSRTHPSPVERYKFIKQKIAFEYRPVQSLPARQQRFQAALGQILGGSVGP